jgi:hypothetical protein
VSRIAHARFHLDRLAELTRVHVPGGYEVVGLLCKRSLGFARLFVGGLRHGSRFVSRIAHARFI